MINASRLGRPCQPASLVSRGRQPNQPGGWVAVTADMLQVIEDKNVSPGGVCTTSVQASPLTVSARAVSGVGDSANPHSPCNFGGCQQLTFVSDSGLRSNWTHIRYTQTFRGTAACYALFGSDIYSFGAPPNGVEPNLPEAEQTLIRMAVDEGEDGKYDAVAAKPF